MESSSVIKYLTELQTAIAYLYCDYRDQNSQTAVNLIGGLAKQLVMQIPPMSQSLWKAYEDTTANISSQEVITLTLHQYFDFAFICIDALDECEPENRKQLLRLLKSLREFPVRIFLTGRQSVEAEVLRTLGELSISTIRIVANEEDIRTCLAEKFVEDPYPEAIDEELRKSITNEVVQRSDGM